MKMTRTFRWYLVAAMLSSVLCVSSHTGNASNISGSIKFSDFSDILDTLLAGYEQNMRPGTTGLHGPPTKVLVDMNIRSMGPISEVDMTYSMDAYFRQTWEDERLMFNGSLEKIAVHISLLTSIWKPDTYFYNDHDAYIHPISTPNKLLRIFQNGTILYSMRLTIHARCPMFLQYFPMDEQSCPLTIGSFAYTVNQIYYMWKHGPGSSIKASEDMALSTFDLVGYPAWNETTSRVGFQYATLNCKFILKRHMGYFLIQVYVPSTLIVILSWVNFWLNREASADRVSLGITCFLTLVTLSLDTRDALPKVEYATALDWFVIMCFIFIIASLLEVAAVLYFTKIGVGEPNLPESAEEDSEEEDENGEQMVYEREVHYKTYMKEMPGMRRRHRLLDPRKDPCVYRFMKCLQGSSQYRRSMKKHSQRSGVNSVSLIDKVSRILFPFTFVTFNVIYWVSYSK